MMKKIIKLTILTLMVLALVFSIWRICDLKGELSRTRERLYTAESEISYKRNAFRDTMDELIKAKSTIQAYHYEMERLIENELVPEKQVISDEYLSDMGWIR